MEGRGRNLVCEIPPTLLNYLQVERGKFSEFFLASNFFVSVCVSLLLFFSIYLFPFSKSSCKNAFPRRAFPSDSVLLTLKQSRAGNRD